MAHYSQKYATIFNWLLASEHGFLKSYAIRFASVYIYNSFRWLLAQNLDLTNIFFSFIYDLRFAFKLGLIQINSKPLFTTIKILARNYQDIIQIFINIEHKKNDNTFNLKSCKKNVHNRPLFFGYIRIIALARFYRVIRVH